MENLIKQARARFADGQLENKDESNETRERKMTSESQSFREKKRGQSWIGRRVSRQKSSDYEFSSNYDYQIAVAAAACAIQSLEEMRSSDYEDRSHGTTSKPDLKSNKSRKEDGVNPPQPRKSAVKSSDQSSKKSLKKDADIKVSISTQKTPAKKPSHKKNKLNFADIDQTITPQHQEVVIERPLDQRPIISPSTSADRHLNISEDKKPKTPDTKPYHPPTSLTSAQDQPVTDAIRLSSNKSSLADAWEKQQMTSIKERYEKTRVTINDWENKKKEQAKHKIEKIEAELYKKRLKSTQRHQFDIKVIEGIAAGARTQAAENKRNEEFNIEDKTNQIRATGKPPPSSFCF